MDKIILHIDFDSFFASCEQQFDPALRGKPIGVTATNGRTCIIAASREAKKLGIKAPGRTWEALLIVPQMIYVPAHFDEYWKITQKFLNICKDYSPFVELFSLDEVFMDITQTAHLFRGKYNIIKTIRKRIASEIGQYITVSVGLSHNKLLSKLGSGMNKPNGFKEINREDIEEVYSKIKLTDLCGIGHRTQKRLNKIGIMTPLDLRVASLKALVSEFKDSEGHFLKSLGEAYDDCDVIPYYIKGETKSVGRNYCLPKNTYSQREVLQHVFELSEEVGIKLRRIGKKGRTVGFYLGGVRSKHGRKTLKDHIDKGYEIFALCKSLYDQWEWDKTPDTKQKMVRQISVWVGNLEDRKNLPLSLFGEEDKKDKVLKIVDQINDRFGSHTIRNGFLLYGPNLRTVPNGYLADKWERSKLVGKTGAI